ncbi:MAG: RNA polymerase sigma factor [Planctomycetota bacterium]
MTKEFERNDREIWDRWVAQCRTDRHALGNLYDQTYPDVFRYCIRRTGNRSTAEDISSSVFLNVAKHIAEFPGRSFEEFRRWVFAISTNEINAHIRKSSRRKSLLIGAAESGQLETSREVPATEMSLLEGAIMRLSERDQSVITLHFFASLPYEEVGKTLSISPGAARTAASRALRKIKCLMEDRK